MRCTACSRSSPPPNRPERFRAMRRRISILLTLAMLFALGAGVIAGLIQMYLRDLPQIKFLAEYRPSASTRLYDIQGRLISELFVERRQPVSLSQVSPWFVKAIVAVEDERFFTHVGVDLKAVARALLADLLSKSFAQGGSTITQQLTRNLFLEADKRMRRKVEEAILAVQIENHYTKTEILELYCNQIYLGSGVYGVEAAARKYFNRSAAELTISQAALIAGLPQRPSAYDPFKYPDRARQRRRMVLQRMLQTRAITPEEYREAEQSSLGLVPSAVSTRAPYFTEFVRQYLEEKYGSEAIYRQGLEVRTTLDLDVQTAAEQAVRAGIEALDKESGWRPPHQREAGEPDPSLAYGDLSSGTVFPAEVIEAAPRLLKVGAGKVRGTVAARADVFPHLASFTGRVAAGQTVLVRPAGDPPYQDPVPLVLEQRPLLQGALVALDPRNGHLRALVGGYDFAASQFNRAVQARRQPGSGIKPFIYAAAIEAGYTPASVIEDSPVKFWDPGAKEWWKPQNYDEKFTGDTTLVEALTHSRNVVTVKLLNHLGVSLAVRFIRRMGVTTPMEPNLSLALGTSEVTLLDLTAAYAVFDNAGVHCRPLAVIKVLDERGKVLEMHEPEYEKVLDPDVAFVVLDMMRSVVNYGTGVVARSLGFPVAAKTGTTNNYQDAWFTGFSADMAAGVWVGYDDNRTMGRRATGAGYAGPLWVDFMGRARAGKPAEEFQPSERIVFREIDMKSGLLTGKECPEGRLAAFIQGTEPRKSCGARGLFERQSPR